MLRQYLLALIGSVQEHHDLRTRAGLVGAKHRVGQAVRYALVNRPLHRVGEVSVRGNIDKTGRGCLGEACLNADLARRHSESILAVALVCELQLIAILVGDGEIIHLIAAVWLDRDGHGAALGGVLRTDGYCQQVRYCTLSLSSRICGMCCGYQGKRSITAWDKRQPRNLVRDPSVH